MRDHQTRGALRSGENSAWERLRLFEEQERLELIEESRTVVADMATQEQLFARFQRKVQDQIGFGRSDELDFTPVEDILVPSRSIGRQLSPTKAEEQMKRLEEPYPSACQNHGQLSPQIQTYYQCKRLNSEKGFHRVSLETFQDLSAFPGYKCTKRN